MGSFKTRAKLIEKLVMPHLTDGSSMIDKLRCTLLFSLWCKLCGCFRGNGGLPVEIGSDKDDDDKDVLGTHVSKEQKSSNLYLYMHIFLATRKRQIYEVWNHLWRCWDKSLTCARLKWTIWMKQFQHLLRT